MILATDAVGEFVMELTVSDGTSFSEPDTAVVTVTEKETGIHPDGLPGKVDVYPNPTSGQLYISVPEGEMIREVEITDMSGRVLLRLTPSHSGPEPLPLNLDAHFTGNRVLVTRITGNQAVTIHKLILQKQ